jgi:hypothetical protein
LDLTIPIPEPGDSLNLFDLAVRKATLATSWNGLRIEDFLRIPHEDRFDP